MHRSHDTGEKNRQISFNIKAMTVDSDKHDKLDSWWSLNKEYI